MNTNKRKTGSTQKKMRPGFGTMDMLLTLIVVAIVVGTAWIIFKKMYIPAQAEKEAARIQSVIGGIERVAQHNGGAYLKQATGTAISGIASIKNQLGGTNGTKDVGTWLYSCPVGGASTVQVVTEKYDDSEKAALIADIIQSEMSPWTATVATDKITFSKANSSCQ
ncbi:MAG: Unknown protein [uncultured Sulfurovum sp.]|uniref:Uncharacterized protein n=1 Tax=uncultured Sulfurovum sp. TaxID=269237 RepID=A0A6S6SNH6_9BACT|nr:MAG: Unknown protein [uncultured Sulfurovum sp.]